MWVGYGGAGYPQWIQSDSSVSGALTYSSIGTGGAVVNGSSSASSGQKLGLLLNSGRTTPVSAKNQPRAWGALACAYLGQPAS